MTYDPTFVERLEDAPEAAQWIIRTLEDHGYETWAVGGAVRDAALGVASKDWDFATRARPKQVQAVFRRTVAIGADHGTIGVLAKDHHMYEVTTFRLDVKPLGRRAVVEFADSLEEDLARRDFTFNALAWHPARGVRDPFSGMDDLAAGILRTVGEPAERFREDRLRVLRGLRFAARYGLKPTPETWAAMQASVGDLRALSAERVREELWKMMEGVPQASVGLELYASCGALAELYPEFAGLGADDAPPLERWQRALRVVDALPRSRPLLRVGALVTEVIEDRSPEVAIALLGRLRCSRADTDTLLSWGTAQKDIPGVSDGPPALRRWLGRVNAPARAGAMRLAVSRARAAEAIGLGPADDHIRSVCALRRELRSNPPLAVGDLEIDGRDIMRLGLGPGPRVGVVLRTLMEQVLDEPARNERDSLLEAAAVLIEAEDRE